MLYWLVLAFCRTVVAIWFDHRVLFASICVRQFLAGESLFEIFYKIVVSIGEVRLHGSIMALGSHLSSEMSKKHTEYHTT